MNHTVTRHKYAYLGLCVMYTYTPVLVGAMCGMLSAYDSIKEFNLKRHFIDRAIFVHPDYRGLGIAQELLRVSEKKDGSVLNLRIVDMPKYLNDEVINLHTNHFVKEEKTFIAAGVVKNAKAIEELQGPLLQVTNEEGFHTVVCCLDNGDDEIKDIVGASMMALTSKNDPEPQFDFKTEELQKLVEIMHGLEAHYNEMKAFDLDRCFSDRGLFVCPEYRGLGIAKELLKVRRLICKEHGIPINGAWMTSYGTQKAAERDGWETVCELTHEELTKKFGITFGKDPPSYNFMIARIQL